jgi:SAM-dependent methyltransferase
VEAALAEEARGILEEHHRVWRRKAVLRRVYREEFFARLLQARRPGGVSVEVGGGPGFLKEICPELVSTDVVWTGWHDVVADAHALPFRSGSVSNVVGLDVLHHLERPMAFLREAERVLVLGGRLILIEPWITPLSYVVYRFLHQEDCDLIANPLSGRALRRHGAKKPFDGNQAVPYLLFRRRALGRTLERLPGRGSGHRPQPGRRARGLPR